MTRQWKRVVRLKLSGSGGSLTVEKLKIDFSISRSIGSKQNTATISVWNLTKSHRKMLGEEYDKVELEAGYEGGPVGTIFKGSVRDVTHTKETADIKSEMECGDGDKGIGKGAVSKTFPAGTKPIDIIKHVVGEMPDVSMGEMKGIEELPAYKRPVTVFGWAFRELDKIGRDHGFYWSLQNEKFQAVKNDKTLSKTTVISRETGMVGIAEVTDKGVKVKCLLRPELQPGHKIDVRSDFLDEPSGKDKRASDDGGGIFRIASLTFNGTNRGQDFYAEIEANRVQSDTVTK